MSDPNDLRTLWDEAWQHLSRGVADARHPARYPTFATVSPEGMPEARTVALRAASQSAARVEVHTDISTAKIRALQATPFAALHVWIPRADLQIRLGARVDILTGPEVEAQWSKVPPASRVSYGTEPAPGVPITHVYDYEKPPTRERFAVLACHLISVDLVHLGGRHRRALYVAKDCWQGTWVAP
ncbi:pyridoxamine 5'-phosphate oxidase family protein [Marimonas sp. MJW-29]|uniref:Pyridoxamine 5'-phosphate oxidase family protein n=1 Tax=Sulfitobacter sediminis TaxID=3234186 RepID=A0ABV3RME7_9RHOB